MGIIKALADFFDFKFYFFQCFWQKYSQLFHQFISRHYALELF